MTSIEFGMQECSWTSDPAYTDISPTQNTQPVGCHTEVTDSYFAVFL